MIFARAAGTKFKIALEGKLKTFQKSKLHKRISKVIPENIRITFELSLGLDSGGFLYVFNSCDLCNFRHFDGIILFMKILGRSDGFVLYKHFENNIHFIFFINKNSIVLFSKKNIFIASFFAAAMWLWGTIGKIFNKYTNCHRWERRQRWQLRMSDRKRFPLSVDLLPLTADVRSSLKIFWQI